MAALPSAPTRGHQRAAPEARRHVCGEKSLVPSLVALLVMQTWHSALSPEGPRPSRLRPPPRNKGEDEVVNEAATRVRRTPVWSECPLLGTGLTFLQGPPSPPLGNTWQPQEGTPIYQLHRQGGCSPTKRGVLVVFLPPDSFICAYRHPLLRG